jgi:hypothetical protein
MVSWYFCSVNTFLFTFKNILLDLRSLSSQRPARSALRLRLTSRSGSPPWVVWSESNICLWFAWCRYTCCQELSQVSRFKRDVTETKQALSRFRNCYKNLEGIIYLRWQIKNCFMRLWNFTWERNNVGCVVISYLKQRNVFVHWLDKLFRINVPGFVEVRVCVRAAKRY